MFTQPMSQQICVFSTALNLTHSLREVLTTFWTKLTGLYSRNTLGKNVPPKRILTCSVEWQSARQFSRKTCCSDRMCVVLLLSTGLKRSSDFDMLWRGVSPTLPALGTLLRVDTPLPVALLLPVRMNDEGAPRLVSAVPVSCPWQRTKDHGVFCGSWASAKVNRNDKLWLYIIWLVVYGMSSFPLTNSYFSRWLKHVKTTNQLCCDFFTTEPCPTAIGGSRPGHVFRPKPGKFTPCGRFRSAIHIECLDKWRETDHHWIFDMAMLQNYCFRPNLDGSISTISSVAIPLILHVGSPHSYNQWQCYIPEIVDCMLYQVVGPPIYAQISPVSHTFVTSECILYIYIYI